MLIPVVKGSQLVVSPFVCRLNGFDNRKRSKILVNSRPPVQALRGVASQRPLIDRVPAAGLQFRVHELVSSVVLPLAVFVQELKCLYALH